MNRSRSRSRSRARRAGFTLVELLVAIGILALVAVLGWRGLDGIVRARVSLTRQMEQTRGMQLAFAQLQSDAEHLAETELLHGRQNLEGGADRLTLVRTVFEENQPARLQVVAYRVRDGVLTRHESAATRDLIGLDTLWRAALGQGVGGGVALQAEVESMTLRLWREGAWRAPVDAAPGTSDAAQAPAGASALEVSLRLRGQELALTKAFLLGAI
jgi:general secretion pathway protein J